MIINENDIASALEFLESDERRRLYSLLGVDKVSDISLILMTR